MKSILLVFALACALAANSQTVVSGPYKIPMDKKHYSNEMEFLRYSDGHYSFMFRNADYIRLVDYKSISFPQDELKDVQQAFIKAATIKPEDHVNYGEFNISRVLIQGRINYLVLKRNATWKLSEAEYKDLLKAIDTEVASIAGK